MTKPTLTLRREGTFTIQTYGPNHCGVESPNQVCQYVFIARCSAKLDKRGFLFDQLNVDAFFQRQKRTRMSCERLVVGYTQKLIRLIRKENPGIEILSTSLELKASPFKASMTYDWVAP